MRNDIDVKTARLFRNGRSQAVRIPKEFELDGAEVAITRNRDGSLIVRSNAIKARTGKDLVKLLRNLGPIPDFPGDPGDEDLLEPDEPDFG